jgi:hypothetical protein
MSKARKERRSIETGNHKEEKQGLSRRALLKNAAGAVIAASGADRWPAAALFLCVFRWGQ